MSSAKTAKKIKAPYPQKVDIQDGIVVSFGSMSISILSKPTTSGWLPEETTMLT